MKAGAELKALLLRQPRLRLAVAESLTCGRLQAAIGRTSGASEFFRGGVTAYDLDGKVRLLGVSRAAAARVNCVSAEVAAEMARGACRLFGADLGVATTGYAEPAPKLGVRHPFAWIAVARKVGRHFEVRTGRIECPGKSRTAVQEAVAAAAYGALLALARELRAPAAARGASGAGPRARG
ncbi:MAG TPA: CinA family protein [Opitutaceae bacterium]|jgi:nicotinamide-nucleotide amidase|nr:CinA family protein [Opitutaceae bacterium]